MDKIVSAVIPVYNEERYIDKCIKSLLLQDYDKNGLEFIFVDGCSQDKTVEIINRYAEQNPGLIRVMNNPHKVAPHAMNIGIENSTSPLTRLNYAVDLRIFFDFVIKKIIKI